MILAILLTAWITCGIIHVSKEMARPFSCCRSNLVILEFILAPYSIASDIIFYWKELKEMRQRYNSK